MKNLSAVDQTMPIARTPYLNMQDCVPVEAQPARHRQQ